LVGQQEQLERDRAAVDAHAAEAERRWALLEKRAGRLADAETALSHRERAARTLVHEAGRALQQSAEVAAREQSVAAVLAELDERGQTLVAAEQALALREQEVADRLDRFVDAEALLEERERAVRERDEWLDRREELLTESEQSLRGLREVLR
jgi:DNA helicase IV